MYHSEPTSLSPDRRWESPYMSRRDRERIPEVKIHVPERYSNKFWRWVIIILAFGWVYNWLFGG